MEGVCLRVARAPNFTVPLHPFYHVKIANIIFRWNHTNIFALSCLLSANHRNLEPSSVSRLPHGPAKVPQRAALEVVGQ